MADEKDKAQDKNKRERLNDEAGKTGGTVVNSGGNAGAGKSGAIIIGGTEPSDAGESGGEQEKPS